jgi:adenylyltransferase/sulfurtransferase
VNLTDAQLDRYARQIVLKEFGGEGQRRLRGAAVVVVGAGGIGSPAIQYLAAAGVGSLTIIDDDHVELSNLQRQVLYGTGDIGHPKARRAKHVVSALNPEVAVDSLAERIDAGNAHRLLEGAATVLDGSDNFATRLVVADAALALRVPLVAAAASEWEGPLSVHRGWEPDKPCYRCLVGDDPARATRSCADVGILGPVAGVMGSLAALEAIRAVAGFGEDSAGKLLLFDALSLRVRTVRLPKDPGCRTCAD